MLQLEVNLHFLGLTLQIQIRHYNYESWLFVVGLEIQRQVSSAVGLLSPLCRVFALCILDLDYGGFIIAATVLQCRTGSDMHTSLKRKF